MGSLGLCPCVVRSSGQGGTRSGSAAVRGQKENNRAWRETEWGLVMQDRGTRANKVWEGRGYMRGITPTTKAGRRERERREKGGSKSTKESGEKQ